MPTTPDWSAPEAHTCWRPGHDVDLLSILGPLCRGRADPTARIAGGAAVRATTNEQGAATVRYEVTGAGVQISAWGPGAQVEVRVGPEVLGAGDDPAGFGWDAHPLIAAAARRHGSWRAPRTGRTWEALAPAILEQRVTGREARRAWASLVSEFGAPAPGPGAAIGLRCCPPAATWARIPTWSYHRAGVDPARMRTLVTAARRAGTLEKLASLPPAEARGRLQALPGIGPWTAAEVAIRAWGDRDAVSFGDFHLPRVVSWNLAGRLDGDDELMAALLAPWAGQRARAVRMIELAGVAPPKRGPRAAITDHRGH